jgi:hypothetical protein
MNVLEHKQTADHDLIIQWPEIEVRQRIDLWAQNLKYSKWRFDSRRGTIAEYKWPLISKYLTCYHDTL